MESRNMTSKEFTAAIIAQDDDQDYDESGWVAFIIDGTAYLGRYSHCSCYGTFTSLCGGGISDYFESGTPVVDWSGTVEELIAMAERKADPAIPWRVSQPEDYDHDHLLAVYSQVLEWSKSLGTQTK